MKGIPLGAASNGNKRAANSRVINQIFLLGAACCGLLHGSEPDRTVQSFVVRDPSHGQLRVEPRANRATAVIFVSAVCPMATDYGPRLVSLTDAYARRGVRTLLIDSNDNESDSQVEQWRMALALPFPVYRDPHTQVAAKLQVYSTPTAVVLDASGTVRYWGSIDDARNPSRVDKPYLRLALDAVLAGESVDRPRTRVLGCSIKRAAH